MRVNLQKILCCIICGFCAAISHAAGVVNVNGLRVWPSPGSVRIVFDLNQTIEYKVYTLSSPNRVVVDLQHAHFKVNLNRLVLDKTKIKHVRVGKPKANITRVVFETTAVVKPNSFILKPNEKYGYRLVVDLESAEKQQILALFALDQIEKPSSVARPSARASAAPIYNMASRNFIIALDAGHGGEDPGAIGPLGTKEKDIALKVARELKAIINQHKGLRAFLIRDGDYYIGLRERMQRARAQNADLFVSIHADAYTSPLARGSSVFVLSKKSASSEAAKWLAEKENRADLVGGISLDNKGNVLASVLLDLSQAANEDASLEAANHVLKSLGRVTVLHKPYVERAGFAVLKAPDVPSILIETGFITNPSTERLLRSDAHRRHLANNIASGIRQYFSGKAMRTMPTAVPTKSAARAPATRIVRGTAHRQQARYYIVRKGDTLSGVAVKHRVSMQKLRLANKLKKDSLFFQQKLIIPTR